MSDPLQHYVPKFMFRRFSYGKNDLVQAVVRHANYENRPMEYA